MTKFMKWFSLVVAVISTFAVAGIVIAEVCVRWKVNQNFTFLGGDTLSALIIATFGLVLGLSYLHRRQ